MTSPAHHAAQTDQNPLAGSLSSSSSTAVPVVALIIIPVIAPRKTRTTPSRSRSSSVRKPTWRSRRKAQTGASVLPVTTSAVDVVTDPVRLVMTRREPSAIPGQTRSPRVSRALSAIPVGGHSGVITAPWTVTFRSSPRSAAT